MKNRKTKILYLIGKLSVGGAEKLALSIACGLDKKKFEPIIVTLYGAEAYEKDLREEGIKLIKLERKSWLDIKAFSTLKRIIRREEVDIVHTYLMPSDIWGGLASKLTGKKAVSSILNMGFSDGRKDKLRSFVSKFFVKLIAVGGAVEKRLIDVHKIKNSKVLVIHNGIETEKFMEARKEIDFSFPVIGMLARLELVKGHIYLLEACSRLKKGGYKFRVIFIGGGSEEKSLEEKVRALELSDSIVFKGFRDDMPKELKDIDIIAAPSLSEGFSLTIIEAMAAGKIVISSRVGGASEVIKDKINGFLIKKKNSQELAKAIKYIINNPERTKAIQQKAFKTAEKFDIKEMISRYENFYGELLND